MIPHPGKSDAGAESAMMDSAPFSIGFGTSSHIGRRRHNQDALLATLAAACPTGVTGLFAVADGMGGQPGGQEASQMVCRSMGQAFDWLAQTSRHPVELSRRLVETIFRIDRHVRLQGNRDSGLTDMGTTLSCLAVSGSHGVIAHVGDSRIYRYRNGRLSCLTVDHTFVQDMISEGEVDPEQAHRHPLRHMLTRAVGTGEPLEQVDTRIDFLKAGDIYLLCTDGLHNTLPEEIIGKVFSRQPDPATAALELVETAFQKGGSDNISAIVVRIE